MTSRPPRTNRRALQSLSEGSAQERSNRGEPRDDSGKGIEYWKAKYHQLLEKQRKPASKDVVLTDEPSSQSLSVPPVASKASTSTPIKKTTQPKKIPKTSSPKGKRKTPSSSSSLSSSSSIIYIDEELKTKRPKPTSSKISESEPTTLSATVNKQLAPTSAKGSVESEEDLLCHESLPPELQSSSSTDSKSEGIGGLDKDSLRAKVWAISEELIKVKHKFATLMEFYKAAGVETEGYVAEIKELKEKNTKLEENQSTYNELKLLNRIQAITIKDLEAKLKSLSGEKFEEPPPGPRNELQLDEIQKLQLALKESQEETRKAKTEAIRAQNQMKEMRDKFLSDVQEISTKTSKQMLLAEEDFDKWKSEMLDSVRDLQAQLERAKNPPAKGSS